MSKFLDLRSPYWYHTSISAQFLLECLMSSNIQPPILVQMATDANTCLMVSLWKLLPISCCNTESYPPGRLFIRSLSLSCAQRWLTRSNLKASTFVLFLWCSKWPVFLPLASLSWISFACYGPPLSGSWVSRRSLLFPLRILNLASRSPILTNNQRRRKVRLLFLCQYHWPNHAS